jgi:hypothetical protein
MVIKTTTTTTTTTPATATANTLLVAALLRMTVSLLLTAGVCAAVAEVSADIGNVIFQDDLAGCTLFVAPSIIPNAGLGIFTTEAYGSEEKLHVLPADIAIPYGFPGYEDDDDDDDGISTREDRIGAMKRYDWRSATADVDEHTYMPYHEGDSLFEYWPGFGAIPNHESHYENVEHGSGPVEDNIEIPVVDQYERPHPGSDGYTPFHHRYVEATQDIAAGAELFLSYGDGYFLYKKDNPYPFVPLDDDYDDAKKLMTQFSRENSHLYHGASKSHMHSEAAKQQQAHQLERLQGLWDRVVEAAPSLRVQTALAKNVTRVLEMHGQEFSLGVNQRPVEWLHREGICVDRVRIGASKIIEAGRGVFAKHHISASTIILPVPVIQMNRTMQQITHHGHNNDTAGISENDIDGIDNDKDMASTINMPLERMIVNYCLGHEESAMLLCPYLTTVSLINHSNDPTKINAKLTLSNSQYTNQALLETSTHDLLEPKRAEKSLGIIFDLVATRDIREGEEIYLNYGSSWQKAWEEHVESWKPFVYDLPEEEAATNEGPIETLVNDCTVDYGDNNGALSDVPKCLESTVFQITQQSPEERQQKTPPTACYYFPDWDSDSLASYDEALDMQEKKVSLNLHYFQVHPWQFEVSGWINTDDDADDDDGEKVVTGTVGGLYPCHVLAPQANQHGEETLYTVVVLLDHDIATMDGMDYDKNDIDEDADANEDNNKGLLSKRNQSKLTRRQVQLVKNVPLRALRGATQAWRDQRPVDHLRDNSGEQDDQAHHAGLIRTPAPFRHFVGVEDDVFPDAWKDLRLPKHDKLAL